MTVTERPAGRRRAAVSLDDRFDPAPGRALLSGIDALVRLVLDQRRLDTARGLHTAAFVSGYEGSPLGGLDLAMASAGRWLDAEDVVVRPAVNEELAATAVGGTQLVDELPGRRYDGVVGFWYGKHPGLDRAADAVRHANHAGTSPLGGVVALVGDDPTAKSSTLPSGCERLVADLGVPLLAPSSVGSLIELGLHAVALSRACGVWAALKVVADLADASATVDLALPLAGVPVPARRTRRPAPLLVGPHAVEAEGDLHDVRLPLAAAYAAEHGLNAVRLDAGRPRLAVLASGTAYAAVVRALADLGIGHAERQQLGLRVVELGVPWPLDHAHLRRLVAGAAEVLVVEDKGPFVETQVREALYPLAQRPVVSGRHDPGGRPLLAARGAVDADAAALALAARLGPSALPPAARRHLERLRRPERIELGAPAARRTPTFCSGCPHNRSTRARPDELVGLGIGCHIMAAFEPGGRGHQVGMTQMGGEGAQWIGMAPFTDDHHYVQNLGDGTFFHSGSLAVRAAVAAGARITYKLLYNDAVAMTGGQPAQGRMDVPTLTRWLALEGVRRVVVTTPDPAAYRGVALDPVAEVRHRDRLDEVMAELAAVDGVTVVVHDDRCAAEERRQRSRGRLATPTRRVWINERVCEGCGDCAERSSCQSVVPVDTEFGRKTAIHQGSCNFDYSCVEGDCPAFVTVETAGRRPAAPERPAPPPVGPPAPARCPGEVVVRLAGIGGTGIVTVSRLLQMAAHLEGRHAAGVDQTGLAQKGGPVVSDLRVADRPVAGQVRAGRGGVDLLLAVDPLAAADPASRAGLDPARTAAVVNGAVVATAAMVAGTEDPFPGPAALSPLTGRCDPAATAVLDAGEVAERLVGQHQAAALVLVGVACQRGWLPLDPAAVEQAIGLNGVAVEANVAAFRWGRVAAADPAALAAALHPPLPLTLGPARRGAPAPPAVAAAASVGGWSPALRQLVARRAADLTDYQSRRYAAGYLAAVVQVAETERRLAPDPAWPVTTTVARQLHRLMAAKDEYEVARLHLLPEEVARRRRALGDGPARVLLRPPSLAALGLRRKLALRRTARPAFVALRAARRLRGTALDPFGHTAARRLDRALPAEYLELVTAALAHLAPGRAAGVVRVAAAADLVRGYEAVRAQGVERFRAEAADALGALSAAADEAGRLPAAG